MLFNDFPSLEIARYEISLRAKAPVSFPPFLGSTLRGAFGHALKKTVCVAPHRDCERCMLIDKCVYPYLFETPAPLDAPQLRGQKSAPHPFILTPPFLGDSSRRTWRAPLQKGLKQNALAAASGNHEAGHANLSVSAYNQEHPVRMSNRWTLQCDTKPIVAEKRQFKAGDTLRFGLTLLGPAIEQLPYVIYAISEMAHCGLGVNRIPFALVDVSSIDISGKKQLIYSGTTGRFSSSGSEPYLLQDLVQFRIKNLIQPLSNFQKEEKERDSITLRFLTPARIRVQDELQAEINFELLVKNLLRRISMLIAVHGKAQMQLDFSGLIERARTIKKVAERLCWDDWERYSNRQQTKMKLGGFIGEIEYCGEAINEYLPLIAAGEFLHIGAGTGFGLGKYTIIK